MKKIIFASLVIFALMTMGAGATSNECASGTHFESKIVKEKVCTTKCLLSFRGKCLISKEDCKMVNTEEGSCVADPAEIIIPETPKEEPKLAENSSASMLMLKPKFTNLNESLTVSGKNISMSWLMNQFSTCKINIKKGGFIVGVVGGGNLATYQTFNFTLEKGTYVLTPICFYKGAYNQLGEYMVGGDKNVTVN